jgi:hypothetical protein
MGLLGLGIGLWVLLYLATHRALDSGAQAVAAATALGCLGFGAYVLIRRVRRGPEH